MLCWCAVVVVIVCYGVMCLDSKQLIGLDTEGCFVSCVLSPCSLSLSLYLLPLHHQHIHFVFFCDVVWFAASRFTLKHRWTFNTHQTLWHTSHCTGSLQHCLFSIQLCDCFFFFIALSLSKNESHSAPGSAAGLHDGTTVTHCFIYIYSRSCHFKCRAKNLMSSHTSNTHTQGNH